MELSMEHERGPEPQENGVLEAQSTQRHSKRLLDQSYDYGFDDLNQVEVVVKPSLFINTTSNPSEDDIKKLLFEFQENYSSEELSEIEMEIISESSESSDSEDDLELLQTKTTTTHSTTNHSSTAHSKRRAKAKAKANTRPTRPFSASNAKSANTQAISNHNLVNPFARKNTSMLLLQDQEIKFDLDLIRKCWLPEASTSSENEKEKGTAIVPINLPLLEPAKSILGRGGRRSLLASSTCYKQPFENNDNCSACLGTGELLCCDTCPQVFHFSCVAEGFRDAHDVPVSSWQCRTCMPRSSDTTHIRVVSESLTCLPEQDDHDPQYPLFKALFSQMDALNPRVFQLPLQIRNEYQHVVTHPVTGEYVDTVHTLLLKSGVASGSGIRASRKRGLSGDVLQDGVASGAFPSFPSSSSLAGPADNNIPSGSASAAAESSIRTCFRCSKSDHVSLAPPPHLSHTFPTTTLHAPQYHRTPLITCDYCSHSWHLDCLDPPLQTVPLALRRDEWPVLDLVAHARLVERIRMGEMHPLDQPLYDMPAVLGKVGEGESYGSADFQLLCVAASGSLIFGSERGVTVRPKWQCPLHAPSRFPGRVKWSDGGGWRGYAERLVALQTQRRVYRAQQVEEDRVAAVEMLQKRGLVDVSVDPARDKVFTVPAVPVAESKILLEFGDRVCVRGDVARKFEEFGRQWSSRRVDELHAVTVGPDLAKFVPLVDNYVAQNTPMPAVSEPGLQESAAALLLFQLELQDRFAERHFGLDPDQA